MVSASANIGLLYQFCRQGVLVGANDFRRPDTAFCGFRRGEMRRVQPRRFSNHLAIHPPGLFDQYWQNTANHGLLELQLLAG